MTARPLARAITESDLQTAVIGLARLRGWRVHHSRPAPNRSGRGWSTAIAGDVGLPDLVLARDGVVLFVELKTEGGRLSEDQRRWGEAIGDRWRLWRPTDWLDGTITKELR